MKQHSKQPVRGGSAVWAVVITSAAGFITALDNLIVTTALPSIREDLGGGLEDLEWTVSAYTLTFAVLLMFGASLGDRFGRRRLFAIGLGIFTAASAAAALAPGMGELIAARAAQGVGSAIVTPLTLTLLSAAVPAERRGAALGVWGAASGIAVATSGLDWTSVFGEEMVKLGREREDIVAITAAMLQPVGLTKFEKAFPDRIYDVGIAEQHGAVSAAGLATGGLHPVFAVYATFLNRAFDQVLMDVALHKCGVTFVLDRAGVTGTDGASHNGMWDMSILQCVPTLRIAAPRDADQVRAQLREAVEVDDAPTVVRFSKGAVGPSVKAVGTVGGMDVLRKPAAARPDVLLVSIGALAPMCLEIADLLDAQGISTTVVDPRWVKPVDEAMAPLAAKHRVVVTVEDNSRAGGVGSAVAQALRDADVDVPLRDFGIPPVFLDHASRKEVMAEIGLTAPDIARQVTGLVARLDGRYETEAESRSVVEPVRD